MTSYAYLHCKPDGTPFYVGKGALRRARYLGERNPYHQAVVGKYGRKNILIGTLECSSSHIALELEVGLIKCLKRMGVELTNFTAGGDGGRQPVPETKKRLSEAAKKRGVSEACRIACVLAKTGAPVAEATKAKLSKAMTGKVFSEAHRANISKSAKARGITKELLNKAWAANRGRIQSEDERKRRGAAISAALKAKREAKNDH